MRVPGNGRPDRDAFARAVRGEGSRVPGAGEDARAQDARIPALPVVAGDRAAADETLALPVDASLTKRDMQRIVSACNALGGLLQPAF